MYIRLNRGLILNRLFSKLFHSKAGFSFIVRKDGIEIVDYKIYISCKIYKHVYNKNREN